MRTERILLYPMDRVVLVTDTDTQLGQSILDTYMAAGERTVAVRIEPPFGGKKSSGDNSGNGNDDALSWNRCSSVDPRNIMIDALRRFSAVDEVIVVQSVEVELPAGPELVDINQAIDYWIKGTMFFVREVLRIFTEKGKGVLALVNHLPSDVGAPGTPLGEAVSAAFGAYIKRMLPIFGGNDIYINGFESTTRSIDEFAQFIHRNMAERFRRISGKFILFHGQGERGLFGKTRR
jgi:hypothetical protein